MTLIDDVCLDWFQEKTVCETDRMIENSIDIRFLLLNDQIWRKSHMKNKYSLNCHSH
jgi:hypothetical protein